jgi:hypothetical protein
MMVTVLSLPRGHSGAKISFVLRILNGANQCLAASDGAIIDQIATREASMSKLRDIVAAIPGATQKPRTKIAPSHAICISSVIFLSYVLINLS